MQEVSGREPISPIDQGNEALSHFSKLGNGWEIPPWLRHIRPEFDFRRWWASYAAVLPAFAAASLSIFLNALQM